MKKIKWLLIFWLFALFWIGSSFGNDYRFFNIEYFSAANQFQNYILNWININTRNMTYYNWTWTWVNSFYRSNRSTLDNSLLDISNYTLTWNVALNVVSPHFYVQDSTKLSLLYRSTNSSYGSYLFPLVSWVNSVDSSFGVFSWLYIRIFSDFANCMVANPVSNPVINGGCSDSSRVFVHYNTKTYDSSRWLISDLAYRDWDWYKGSISSSVWNTYSFAVWVNPIITWNDAYLDDSDFVWLRTVVPTLTWDYIFYNNLYLVRLNNLESVLDFSDFQVLAIFLTWNSDDTFDFLYSIYNCPYSSDDISDCSFSEGWNILPSNLDNSFISFSWSLFSWWIHLSSSISNARLYYILQNFLFFLSLPANYNNSNLSLSYKVFTSYNNSTNIVYFSRPWRTNWNFFYTYSYSVFLDSSANINVLDWILTPDDSWWWWSQSPYNTWLIEMCRDLVNWNWFLNLNIALQSLCRSYFPWLSPTEIPWYTWYYVQYSIDESWNVITWVTYQEDFSGAIGDWYYDEAYDAWYSYCTWVWCKYFSTWSSQLQTWTLYSWYMLNEKYYEDFFDKRFFFDCPYSYESSYFVLGESIIDNLGFDPMLPINCMIAAYSQWSKFTFFWNLDWWDKYWTWTLFKNSNSLNARRLYTFFDLILWFWLLVLILKIFNLLRWEK